MDEIIKLFQNATTEEEKRILLKKYRLDIFKYLMEQIDQAFEEEKNKKSEE